jgi:hypothetical protein
MQLQPLPRYCLSCFSYAHPRGEVHKYGLQSPKLVPYRFKLRTFKCINYYYYGSTALCWALAAISVPWSYRVGKTPRTGDQPVARPLPTQGTTKPQKKRTQTSMPWVGFEPTIPVFERAKTVHALDRADTEVYVTYTRTRCTRGNKQHK